MNPKNSALAHSHQLWPHLALQLLCHQEALHSIEQGLGFVRGEVRASSSPLTMHIPALGHMIRRSKPGNTVAQLPL